MTDNMKKVKLLLIENNMKFKDLLRITKYTTEWGLRKAINNENNSELVEEIRKKILSMQLLTSNKV